MNYQEHKAHGNEPPVQAEEPQVQDDEHRAHESFHTGSQRMIISSPPKSPHANSKLEEVDKVVYSIDSRMIYMESKITSIDSRMLSIDSRMASMDFKLKSMDSKLEELLKNQSFMKNQSGLFQRTFYDKVDTLATNVTSSQTTLETSLFCQLAVQQYQFTTELDMVKMQLAELVDNFKKIGDAKKGEGGQSRPVDVSSRPGGEGSSGGVVHEVEDQSQEEEEEEVHEDTYRVMIEKDLKGANGFEARVV
ncbi:nuclear matrix constituent protein 1-like protein [Dorcoceras hygrometricum]|uniref:Nuclear matrix constituent protein 1-like protein n=1 Tax=Dorcoceras hygrometricum TaxID=472368 RepID=A0A2Z7BQY6_9LAMI|nr:nuclear matrix constituent protein 1-like protein [Dorcoceras hygrometricum]